MFAPEPHPCLQCQLFHSQRTALTGQQIQPVDIFRCKPVLLADNVEKVFVGDISLTELYGQALQ
ncbi:hypothetical protein D3C78_1569600 [compost metagenome]